MNSTAPLADPSLRSALVSMARKRVPPSEVDEIVQATLTEAIASPHRPAEGEALRRWVHGIARHKIADFHRRNRREELGLDDDEVAVGAADDHVHTGEAPHDAVDLLRWAEREAPEQPGASRTLEWMLREGEGEKLESIARDESLPAPQVRQRVARLRRHFRARWAAQIAAAALLLAIGALVVWYLRRRVPMTRPGSSTTELVDPIARGTEILAEAHIGSHVAPKAPTPAPAPVPAPFPASTLKTKIGKPPTNVPAAKPKATNAPDFSDTK